jgi:hypothetical protein
MLGAAFLTTANYGDSQLEVGREVQFIVNSDHATFFQTARINPKDKSIIWERADIPLPACDIRFSKIAGIRFKSNGGAANVTVLWTFSTDDVQIDSFSSNL